MRRACAPLLLLASLAGPALAEGDPLAEAKALFSAGARAYDKGDYAAAIQAFDEVYKRTQRPGILFSMAQAYRRQYALDKSPATLAAAIQHYRDYLAKDGQGNRRGDSAAALSELEPIAARLGAGSDAAATPVAATPIAAKPATRLMISTAAEGASIALDRKKAEALPFIATVAPGKHRFKVSAAGFDDYEREIQVAEGAVLALDVPLAERPAQVVVLDAEGAEVAIDGRPAGTLPLPRPLELEPGRHFVAITRNGAYAFTRDIDVKRGEKLTLRAELPSTKQRVWSWVFFSAGALGALSGAGLALGAAEQQNQAKALLAKRDAEGLTSAEASRYEDATSQRDTLRIGSGVGFGTAVVLGGTGFLLYVFDQPTVRLPEIGRERPKHEPKTVPAAPSMEMSAVPVVGPGLFGAALGGRF